MEVSTIRKRYKKKRRTCALCHGNKRGMSPRWTDRELQQLREFERIQADELRPVVEFRRTR